MCVQFTPSYTPGTIFKSQACVTFLSTWLTILSLYTTLCICISPVGQMYIKRFTNGMFFMMNFYQSRIRQMWNWWSCPLSVFSFGFLGFVQTPLCRYFIPIYREVRCSILYLYQQTKRHLKLLQFNNGWTLYQVRFWIWFFQAHDYHNTIQ